MELDDGPVPDQQPSSMVIDTTSEHIQSMLEWKNELNPKKLHKKDISNLYDFEKVSSFLLDVEEKITEYLKQNDKEWNFSDIRANWVIYLLIILIP